MANEPTMEQMNEVIALFMGYEKVTVSYFGSYDETEWQRKHAFWMDKVGMEMIGDYFVDVANDEWIHCEDINYHICWDALMEVGKKIYNMLAEMAKQRPPHTACHGDMIEVDIHCYIGEYNREKAHEAMYRFITWYNQQKQKDGTV